MCSLCKILLYSQNCLDRTKLNICWNPLSYLLNHRQWDLAEFAFKNLTAFTSWYSSPHTSTRTSRFQAPSAFRIFLYVTYWRSAIVSLQVHIPPTLMITSPLNIPHNSQSRIKMMSTSASWVTSLNTTWERFCHQSKRKHKNHLNQTFIQFPSKKGNTFSGETENQQPTKWNQSKAL